jgi:hypothetical protein
MASHASEFYSNSNLMPRRFFAWEELRLVLQASVLHVLVVAVAVVVAVCQKRNSFVVEEVVMEVVEEAEEMLAPKVAVSVLPAHTLFSPFSSLARRASVVCPLQHPVFAESRDDSNLLSFGNSLVGKREAKASYL